MKSIFGRSYAYADDNNPERIGPGPYGRLRVVAIAMDAWQAGYKAAMKDRISLQKRRVRRKAAALKLANGVTDKKRNRLLEPNPTYGFMK